MYNITLVDGDISYDSIATYLIFLSHSILGQPFLS